MNDKLDFDADPDYSEEIWNRKTEAEIKREWDHLLDNDTQQQDTADQGSVKQYSSQPKHG